MAGAGRPQESHGPQRRVDGSAAARPGAVLSAIFVLAGPVAVAATQGVDAADAAVRPASRLTCAPGQAPLRVPLEPGDTVRLDLPTSPGGALLEELGSDVTYALDGAADFREVDIKPPRLGVAVLPATATTLALRLRPHQGAAAVHVWPLCTGNGAADFFNGLDQLYRDAINPGGDAAMRVRPALRALADVTPDSWRRAWLRQADANVLLLAGHSADAAAGFLASRDLWLAAGDPGRAAVALMAAAEDASRAGDYARAEQMLTLSVDELQRAGLAYFALRAQAAICLVHSRRGEILRAADCEEPVAVAMHQIGERSEAAARDISLAGVRLRSGDLPATRRHLARADDASDSVTATVRTRLHRAHGNYFLATGDLMAGARELALAAAGIGNLQLATEKSDLLLKLARLAALTGAEAEERRFLEQALAELRKQDAPDLYLDALVHYIRVLLRSSQLDGSRVRVREAQAHCQRFGVAGCVERVALLAARQALARGHLDTAADELGFAGGELAPALAVERQVLVARMSLGRGDAMVALAISDALQGASASIEQLVEATEVQSSALALQNQNGMARTAILSTIAGLSNHIDAWPSVVLRTYARRHIARLRAHAIDLSGLSAGNRLTAEQSTFLANLMSANPGPARRFRDGNSQVGLSDHVRDQLARLESLADDKPDLIAPFSAMLLLGIDAAATDAAPQFLPHEVRAPSSTHLLLLPLVGQEQVALVAASDTSAQTCLVTSRVQYDREFARFEQAMAGSTAHLAPLNEVATSWYEAIANCQSNPEQRTNWLILQPPTEPALPWAWIAAQADTVGKPEPAVTMVFSIPKEPMTPPAAERSLLVVNLELTDTMRLPFARAEQEGVVSTLFDQQIAVESSAHGAIDGSDLLKAMESSTRWVHLIGHGNTPEVTPLFTGIWLPGSNGPSLLTFADIANSRISSELVVLSACGAGPGLQSSTSIHLHLAESFLAAGARYVVSSSNWLSDSAAPVWTSHFYRELAISGDPAVALRIARSALRTSVHFRHPRHWAGLNLYVNSSFHYQPDL